MEEHNPKTEEHNGKDYRDTIKAEVVPQPDKRFPVIAFLPPPCIYDACLKTGIEKGHHSWWKTFILAVLAGVYVAFGACLGYGIAGEVDGIASSNPGVQKLLLGAFGLPFGLTFIVITGADLYTANTVYMPLAIYEGKGTFLQLAQNWVISFIGNMAGCLFIVWLVDESVIFRSTALDASLSGHHYAIDTAVNRTFQPFGVMVVRGLLANWLVTLAYWQATGAQDIFGRILAIYFPVLAFDALEWDHVIADMFLVCFGMKSGAPVTVGEYIVHNLIPVLIGNTIAGAFFMALPYSLVYGGLMPRITNYLKKVMHGNLLPSHQMKDAPDTDGSAQA